MCATGKMNIYNIYTHTMLLVIKNFKYKLSKQAIKATNSC